MGGCSKFHITPYNTHVPHIPITFRDFHIAAGCQVGIGKSERASLFCAEKSNL